MARDTGPDPVEAACGRLTGYLQLLEQLMTEPAGAYGGPAALASRPAHAPEPYGPAGRALMTVLEGIRRLEASIRLHTSGVLGRRRPLSVVHTDAVLTSLPKLAAGLTRAGHEEAAWVLESWIGQIRAVPGIDEARRWRLLPRRDDGTGLRPECPYCRTMWLKADMDAGVVACFVPDCEGDGGALRPVATMGTDPTGRPCLRWPDGKIQVVPDIQEAAA
jgi:hypothetical protein